MRSMLFSVLVLIGCATVDVERVKGPDGERAMLMTCGDLVDCYNEAAARCGQYKILDSGSEDFVVQGGLVGYAPIHGTRHKVLAACK
jgi:hypothetical protein